MLALFANQKPYFDVIPLTALVTEGGGQRGIFTAGVLDTWLEHQFNPFELLIGTSAGAQNLSSYLAGQSGFGRKSITELSKDKHFFKLSRSIFGGHVVDLDWYFSQIKQADHKLNIDAALTRLQGRKLLFSATRLRDYKAQYFTPNKDNWLTLLKASSALPFLYRQGVDIDGEFHVDGGLSAPIPVQQAYHFGAKVIVVIRTVPHAHHKHSDLMYKVKHWISHSHHCPKPIDFMLHNEDAYDSALAFIDRPPKDIKIIEIHPKHALASRILGSHDDELEQDYDAGKQAAIDFLIQYHNLFKSLKPRQQPSLSSFNV